MFQKLAMAVCFGAIVAACSGGAGSGISSGPSTDPAARGPEGAVSSGDPGGCAPCRGFYHCAGTFQGKDLSGGVTFVSNSPACPQGAQSGDGVFLACGGSIVSGPKALEGLPPNSVVGKWTDVGGGTIVACVRVEGVDDCITCTPATESVNTPGGNDGGPRRRDGG